MAISDTMKRNPVYQEVLGLMEAPKAKAVKEWHKEKLAYMKANYVPYVSKNMVDTYKTTLALYAQTLENNYTAYKVAGTAGKETILVNLITRDRRELANCIDLMNRERQNSVRTAPRTSRSTSESKKSGWWKHALGYGVLGTTLLTALFNRDKNQNQSGPDERDKSAVRMEQRMDALEKRLANGSTGNVVQRGNTFVAETAQQTGRRVIAEAMNPDSNPIPADVHQGRLIRQQQQLAQARYNTANAREAALTTGYMRQANDNVLGMTRDEAYTGAYVSGENLQTARNLRAISDETSPLTSLTDTLRRGTGAFDAGSDLVKSARHFRDSIRGHRGHQ